MRYFTIVYLLGMVHCFAFAQSDSLYTVFEPGIISREGIKEGSPSVTADGNTFVFVRYQSYGDKVPYQATRKGSSWEVERLNFVDTLYNLAIAPDGKRIVYKTRNFEGGDERISRAFYVDRQPGGSWGEPVALQGEILGQAGYFRIAKDGTLYMFAFADSGKGIYYSEPDGKGGYEPAEWVSDAISPYGAVCYGAVVNDDETKMIVNHAGLRTDEAKQRFGPKGLHYHEKHGEVWDYGKRMKGLPYSWYSTVIPDGRLVFNYDGNLYVTPLSDLGISWNGAD